MAFLGVMPQLRAGRKAILARRVPVASEVTAGEDRWPMMTALVVWSLVSAVAWGGVIAAAMALF
jgi:hypothetical protein